MATVQELVATTWEKREKKPADLVLDNIAYLRILKKKDRVKVIAGGSSILEPARIDQNQYVQRIDARQDIDMGYNPTINKFEFSPKIYVPSASASIAHILPSHRYDPALK